MGNRGDKMRLSARHYSLQLNNLSLLISCSLLFGACAGGIEQTSSSVPIQNLSNLEICNKEYYDGQHFAALDDVVRIPINAPIRLTFSEVVDKYSPYAPNFELFTEDGSRFAGKLLVSHQLFSPPTNHPCYHVPRDVNDSTTVSQITLTPNSVPATYLIPSRDYFLILRNRPAQLNAPPEDISVGIVGNKTHASLQQQSIHFKSGTAAIGIEGRNRLDIVAFGPGSLITMNSETNSSRFRDLLTVKDVTMTPNAPIYITFSEPFRHRVFDAGGNAMADIPRTNLRNFTGLGVGVIADAQQFGDLMSHVPDAVTNPAAWGQFRDSNLFNALNMTVRSVGRKTLIIEPVPGEFYPDTAAQVVVTIIQGFVARETRVPQRFTNMVGKFIHLSNLTLDHGFGDPRDFVFGGSP
jgi:hypothetical protein